MIEAVEVGFASTIAEVTEEKHAFANKRLAHYNEFKVLQALKRMTDNDDDDDDED